MKDKFIQAIKYITQEEDFSNVQLIIYLADKIHINSYGRPLVQVLYKQYNTKLIPNYINNDILNKYIKLSNSITLDEQWLSISDIKAIKDSINILNKGNYNEVLLDFESFKEECLGKTSIESSKLLFNRYTKIIDDLVDIDTSKFCLDYYNYWSNIQQHLKK